MCGAASEHVLRYGGAQRKEVSTLVASAVAEVASSSLSPSHSSIRDSQTVVHDSPGWPRYDHARVGGVKSSTSTKSPPLRPTLGASVELPPDEGADGQ